MLDYRLKHKILNSAFYSLDDMQEILAKKKYTDFSGCYLFFVYHQEANICLEKYNDIYIGQSIHVYQRLKQHLSGHGNKSVYKSIMQGHTIYIVAIECSYNQLNRMEKNLIRIFHATKSFNKTRGGAKKQ